MRITIMIKSTGMTNMDTANVMDMKNAAAISHMTNRSMDTVNVMDATVMHITDMNTGMTNTDTANVIHMSTKSVMDMNMSTKSVTDMDIIMQMRFLLAGEKKPRINMTGL